MRVNHVKKAQKDQGECLKCHKAIKAGDAYSWLKGRNGPRKVVCGSCQFSDSDKTGSDKLGRVYDARDAALEAVGNWAIEDDPEDLKSALEEHIEALREVANEYQESADSIHQNFSESSTADECEEKSQEIEGYADEIEGAFDNVDEWDEDAIREELREEYEAENPKDETDEQAPASLKAYEEARDAEVERRIKDRRNDWGEELRSAIEDAVNNCPV
jgi:hypothetical protein